MLGTEEDEVEQSWAIEGEAALNEADFHEAWAAVPTFRIFRRLWLVVPLFGLASYQSYALGGTVPPWPLILPLVFGLGLAVWFPYATRRGWAKRAAAEHDSERVRVRFDDHGLTYESKLRRHQLSWEALPQHIETAQSFLVYTGAQTLLLVPKRAFGNHDVVQLRSLLRERIPPKPIKRQAGRMLLLWVALLVAFLAVWQFLDQAR